MTENNFQIDSAAISDRGLSEKRPQNEDSFAELNKQGLFVVADGVGGAQAGDVASQMAVEIISEAFINLQKKGDAEDLMKLAIERANEAIYQMSHDLAQLSTMATTIVALHVAGNIATIGHVGDSRIYRLDAKGNLYRETQDHSVVEEEVRAGRMTAEQAKNHPSKNVISRALGADQTVEVDMKTIMIEPNTMFLLCSDGITRHIDDFQLRELLQYKDTPANICKRMKEICYERGAEDNLTAVIAKVTDKIIVNSADEQIETPVDLEESTVATARLQNNAEISSAATQESNAVRAEPSKVITEDSVLNELDKNEASYNAAQKKGNAAAGGKFLSSLGLLILGAIIGFGIYYLLAQNSKPAEVPSQATQPPPEYTVFENTRRSVDRDPNAFILKNAGVVQDTENLYLLGRAYLLTGKFPEAKKSFEEAKNKLVQAGENNKQILTNEIAMGLAIIDDPAAQAKFQSEISK